MVPIKKVEDLINKHSNLEKELSSGNVDKKLFAEKSKEYSNLNEIIKEAKDYISFEKNKNDLEKIINDSSSDKEIKEIAYMELQEIINTSSPSNKPWWIAGGAAGGAAITLGIVYAVLQASGD